MTLDDRIARAINVTMVTALVLALCGFVAWALVTEFGHVSEIYAALAPEEQRHVERFGFALLMLLVTLRLVAWLASAARTRNIPEAA